MKKKIRATSCFMWLVLVVPLAVRGAEAKVGYLGVVVRNPLTDSIKGPYILTVDRDSPAARAGIRKYDVILAIGDSRIPDAITYIEKIASLTPVQMVQLKIWRKGTEMPVDVTVGSRPLFNTELRQKDPPRVDGGTIYGGGISIEGSTAGGGNVIIRDAPMHVRKSFMLRWTGVLDIHIDRRTDHALLRVDGDAYLSGILYVGISKIEPRPGDKFELISNAKSIRGRFGKVMLPTTKNTQCRIVYDDLKNKQDLDGDGKYDVTLVFEAAEKTPK